MNIEIIRQAIGELAALKARCQSRLPEHDKYLRVDLSINGCDDSAPAEISLYHSQAVQYTGPVELAEQRFTEEIPDAATAIQRNIDRLEKQLAAEREHLAKAQPAEAA